MFGSTASAVAIAPRPRSLRAALHRTMLASHRWTGLSIGLVLVFMAATGICVAYRSAMEPVVYKKLLTAPACRTNVSLDTLAARAAQVHPKGELDYIRIKGAGPAGGRTTQVRLAGPGMQDDVFFDPCSGTVVGQRGRYGGFFGTFEKLHRFRFMKNGNLIGGTAALLFVVLLAGAGIWLWAPRCAKALKCALKPNPRLRGRERTLNRHKVVGVYAAIILVPTALTGLPQAFDWYKDAIYRMTSSAKVKGPESTPVAGTAPLGMEAYWRKLQALVADPAEALIHRPSAPRDPVEIYAIERGAPHANARTLLFLDAYSGEVLRFVPYAQSSLGHRIYFWTLSWHTGMVGGLAGPLVLVTGALALIYLAWTGITSMVRRSLAPRRC